MAAVAPDPTKDYPVVLGESCTGNAEASYHSLQYKFKPQSSGRKRPGKFSLSETSVRHDSAAVCLSFTHTWQPKQNALHWCNCKACNR